MDDHAVLRSGLSLLLNAQTDLEVVGEAATAEEALAQNLEYCPDIVLLDLSMPGIGGQEAISYFKSKYPVVRILVLTMHDEAGYLRMVLQAGASGYILKRAADVELLVAIRAVHRGEMFLEPALARGLIDNLFPAKTSVSCDMHLEQQLTKRETELLQLIAMGYTNKQIAEKLIISVKTVESHKVKIKEKLNLSCRADMVRYAMQTGLLSAGFPG